jgi:peptidoglycan hydrolase CwlO-like protein
MACHYTTYKDENGKKVRIFIPECYGNLYNEKDEYCLCIDKPVENITNYQQAYTNLLHQYKQLQNKLSEVIDEMEELQNQINGLHT